jgi:hypothetical protein
LTDKVADCPALINALAGDVLITGRQTLTVKVEVSLQHEPFVTRAQYEVVCVGAVWK